MRFRMAQCLCTRRHAIFGFAVHDESTTNDEILNMLQEAVVALVHGEGKRFGAPIEKINPWCGLCGELIGGWLYEVALSKEFPSWDEAQKVLKEMEHQQQRSRELMDVLGFSYDSGQWKKKAERN